MKKIEAVIRKSKFYDVKHALHNIGIIFFTYWDVTGVGNEKKGSVYRGVPYSTTDIQRRYLVIVVNDDIANITIQTILNTSQTGEVGDGKLFVSDVNECYRIRTNEQGETSLN
ncbi:P-II family nitrogen regulator [Mangrovimonas aestuarii]|uniref:P-II family nitrogen regulator n=1 Tax=Mangrovimonas aestuarii TaxID=3018443 RepID=UPI00237895CB|nr:P-II family nitrogen regulator [Mangrovimonas aestuarii]